MKNRFLMEMVFAAFAVFTLSACGGDSNTTSAGPAKQSNADMEVDSYNQLPSCAEKREGKTAYVVDQDQGYVCKKGEWVESDVVETNNSSSLTSSGSVKSSSSINGSSETVYQVEVVDPGNVKKGTMTDSRDGKTYKTVTIGSQTWMAENLNYERACNSCYGNKAEYCTEYGRLYSWDAAMEACPSGWHLPTSTEWNILFTAVGGQSTAGKMLKSQTGWMNNGNGTDAFGFSALPAGGRDGDGYFDLFNVGDVALFWSSTDFGYLYAKVMDLSSRLDSAFLDGFHEAYDFSVRCLRD